MKCDFRCKWPLRKVAQFSQPVLLSTIEVHATAFRGGGVQYFQLSCLKNFGLCFHFKNVLKCHAGQKNRSPF
jgi:hypothetical protein